MEKKPKQIKEQPVKTVVQLIDIALTDDEKQLIIDFDKAQDEMQGIISKLKNFKEITSDEINNHIINEGKSANEFIKAVEKHKQELNRPLREKQSLYVSVAKKITEPIENELVRLRKLITAYQTEKERKRQEELRRIEEEKRKRELEEHKKIEQARKKELDENELEARSKLIDFLTKNDLPEIAYKTEYYIGKYGSASKALVKKDEIIKEFQASQFQVEEEEKLKSEDKPKNIRKDIKFKVVEPDKVPRKYLKVDEAEIRDELKKYRQVLLDDIKALKIAGVHIYIEENAILK